jgi:hypothetical protein
MLARDPDYREEGDAAINLATDESAGTSGLQKAAPAKRSRLSSRDQRLGQSLADNRLKVAERSAELREQIAKDVVDLTLKGKKELMDMQTKVQVKIANDDRAVQRDMIQVHRDALDMQRNNKKKVRKSCR